MKKNNEDVKEMIAATGLLYIGIFLGSILTIGWGFEKIFKLSLIFSLICILSYFLFERMEFPISTVLDSNSLRAFFATAPPFLPALAFSFNP